MPTLPVSLLYPAVEDPVKRQNIIDFFKTLDDWVNQTATTINTGVLARLITTAIAVTIGAGSVVVTLAIAQPTAAYMVVIETNWNTTHWMTAKSVTAFTVNFGTAAPGGAVFSWALLR